MTQETIELESARLLTGRTDDRPTFHGVMGGRDYQVFCCNEGLLFLEVMVSTSGKKMTDSKYAIIGGLLGGAIGATAGMMLDKKGHEKKCGVMQLCSLKSDDELFALAKSRKNSFVVFYDEMKWAKLLAPRGKKIRHGKILQGQLIFKAKGIGKRVMDIIDANVMGVAVDALPNRLNDRVDIDAEFDKQQLRYVPCG